MLNRTVYSGLSYLLSPFAVARLLYLSRTHAGYAEHIKQRFGHLDLDPLPGNQLEEKPLWLHAVSVGEVIASEPFVYGLLSRYPQLRICITTTTPTGADQVRRSFAERYADNVVHQYAPYDLPGAVNRFIDQLNPCALVIMETELWPNWLALMSKRTLPTILINGRMSEKSARGYAKLRPLSKDMFAQLSCVSAQTEQDAARFRHLGAQNIWVSGSLKADFELDKATRSRAKHLAKTLGINQRSDALIAASTHRGEDDIIIEAFLALRVSRPRLRLILVPRHPDRAIAIAQICQAMGLGYRLSSESKALDEDQPLLICDQIGELRSLYGLASIALMGGTLIDHGGHNPLEPAAWGSAIVAGPSQRNFDSIFQGLEQAGAMTRVLPETQSLVKQISALLDSHRAVRAMGESALSYLEGNRGATEKNLDLVAELVKLPAAPMAG